jgi:hypothetical protein
MTLSNMLKTGGKLVMAFQPTWARTDADIKQEGNRVSKDFEEAGLVDVQLEFKDAHPVSYIAATGFKDY